VASTMNSLWWSLPPLLKSPTIPRYFKSREKSSLEFLNLVSCQEWEKTNLQENKEICASWKYLDLNFHLVNIILISLNVIVSKFLNYTSFLTDHIRHTHRSQNTLKILTQFKTLCPYSRWVYQAKLLFGILKRSHFTST